MRIKSGFIGKNVWLVIVAIAVLLAACPGEAPNNNNNGPDFEIAGTYNFTSLNLYTWVFNTNKTFKISWVQYTTEHNYTGNWSVSGDEITLKMDAVMGNDIPSEKFTASRSGKEVTLTLKGNAQVSAIFAGFGLAAKSLTMTEGSGSSGGSTDFTFEDNGSGITITGYTGRGGAVNIPAEINGKPVISIGDYAFVDTTQQSWRGKELTSVTIPNSVTTIGAGAFRSNRLTSVTIPNSVTTIGEDAFYDNRLTSVTIGNSVTTIGDFAFGSNQLTSVTIPNSVTYLSGFSYNRLTSVTIPNSVTTIGDRAFSSNQLTSVTISNSVTTIVNEAFARNQLTSVIIPNSVTTIGSGAFNTNPLISVTIGANVQLDRNSFPGTSNDVYNFYDCYNYNKAAGTYTRQGTSDTWKRPN